MKIGITSDSTCDLSHLVKERNIEIMSLKVNLDMEEYYDGINITPEDIFAFVEKTKILPKTSAPSVFDYQEFFKKQLETYDEIIHFNISSHCSVSHNNAKTAAQDFENKVHVIDSLALSTGQGLLVLKAADMRDEGKEVDEIVETVLSLREKVNTSFVPDCLDYLHKGGRVSSLTLYGANILKIHPQILMQDGKLVPGKKYRGKMEVCLKQYVDDLKNLYQSYDKTRCFVTHSMVDKEIVDMVKEKVKESFSFDKIEETTAGSIVTSHCGKGTLGVLFIYN